MADFDMVAAELKLMQRDKDAFLEILADKLQAALPGRVRTRRQWGPLGGRLREIEIQFNDRMYRIVSEHTGTYTVHRQPVAHGITVGMTETLPAGSWVDILVEDLARYAESEGLSAQSLERLIIGP